MALKPCVHLSAILFLVTTSVLVVNILRRGIATGPVEHTYRGHDFPMTWTIPKLSTIKLAHEDSVHYDLETDLGVAEWKATLPSGGALLYLGSERRPFTLSMLHQLQCLDIIREIIVDFYLDTSPNATYKRPELARHCMNYLRQSALCRADLRLEHVRAPSGPKITVSEVTHTCRDWTAVYTAAERNYAEYLSILGDQPGV